MQKKQPKCHHPVCMLSHEIINKLAVIVSSCDLLEDAGEQVDRVAHLNRIREAARFTAEKLQREQCRLAHLLKSDEYEHRGEIKRVV